jgi:hypothetical protein
MRFLIHLWWRVLGWLSFFFSLLRPFSHFRQGHKNLVAYLFDPADAGHWVARRFALQCDAATFASGDVAVVRIGSDGWRNYDKMEINKI